MTPIETNSDVTTNSASDATSASEGEPSPEELEAVFDIVMISAAGILQETFAMDQEAAQDDEA